MYLFLWQPELPCVCAGLPSPLTRASLSITVPGCSRGWASHEQHSSFPPVGVGKRAGLPGGCCGEGCCPLAPMLRPQHSGHQCALRVHGSGWMAWQVSRDLVRLSAGTGRGHRMLTCPGSPAGTCGGRDGAVSHAPNTPVPQQLQPHTLTIPPVLPLLLSAPASSCHPKAWPAPG